MRKFLLAKFLVANFPVAKFLFVLLVSVAVLGLIGYVFRGPIALRVVPWAATAALQRNFVADQPDGLHLVLVGAGGPLADPLRSGPCVAVLAGRSLFVVDAGAGAARGLGRLGMTPGLVQALFLTHYHSDHIDGLGELMMQRWTSASNARPLPVIGPIGVSEVVAGFNLAYRQDSLFRTAHHGSAVAPPSGAGGVARPFAQPPPLQAVVVWDRDGVKVSAFRVDHAPVDPAVGYRFDYRGRSLVISGDTKMSANVQHFAQGVDLLVHEALSPRLVAVLGAAARTAGRAGIAKIMADIPGYHTTPVQAARIASAAGVRQLLLYHVVPPLVVPGLEAAFLEGVRDAYQGPVTVGRDGTMVSLPSASMEIARRELR